MPVPVNLYVPIFKDEQTFRDILTNYKGHVIDLEQLNITMQQQPQIYVKNSLLYEFYKLCNPTQNPPRINSIYYEHTVPVNNPNHHFDWQLVNQYPVNQNSLYTPSYLVGQGPTQQIVYVNTSHSHFDLQSVNQYPANPNLLYTSSYLVGQGTTPQIVYMNNPPPLQYPIPGSNEGYHNNLLQAAVVTPVPHAVSHRGAVAANDAAAVEGAGDGVGVANVAPAANDAGARDGVGVAPVPHKAAGAHADKIREIFPVLNKKPVLDVIKEEDEQIIMEEEHKSEKRVIFTPSRSEIILILREEICDAACKLAANEGETSNNANLQEIRKLVIEKKDIEKSINKSQLHEQELSDMSSKNLKAAKLFKQKLSDMRSKNLKAARLFKQGLSNVKNEIFEAACKLAENEDKTSGNANLQEIRECLKDIKSISSFSEDQLKKYISKNHKYTTPTTTPSEVSTTLFDHGKGDNKVETFRI